MQLAPLQPMWMAAGAALFAHPVGGYACAARRLDTFHHGRLHPLLLPQKEANLNAPAIKKWLSGAQRLLHAGCTLGNVTCRVQPRSPDIRRTRGTRCRAWQPGQCVVGISRQTLKSSVC